jgi:peptide/nickel transport system permease protein
MAAGSTVLQPSGASSRTRLVRFLRARPAVAVGMAGLTLIVLIAVFAPLITAYGPYEPDIVNRRLPPIWDAWFNPDSRATWAHPLGTDNVGRDFWARIAYGARVSLVVGVLSALLAILIGATIGVMAGYFGGRVDLVANFLIQTRLSVPVILVAMLAISSLGGSLLLVVLICGLSLWDRAAVVSRAVTKQVTSLEFITAARALGASDIRIILTEVLPNIASPLFVVLTIEMGQSILFEASLSFLGLGVPPPTPSWGLMLAEAKEDIFFAPWTIAMPGLALFLLVLFATLIGDGLQDDRTRAI